MASAPSGLRATYNFSPSGTLAYVPGTASDSVLTQLVWVDRDGGLIAPIGDQRPYAVPHLSQDGRQLAVRVHRADGSDLWILDTTRGSMTRLTFDRDVCCPVWMPDGSRLMYVSRRGPTLEGSVVSAPADGSQPAVELIAVTNRYAPEAVSPDGPALIVRRDDGPDTASALAIQRLARGAPHGALQPFVESSHSLNHFRFSPDGRFVSFSSTESGRSEVFVTSYPGPGGKWQVSTSGGSAPEWRADGRELFYRQGNFVMSVDVDTRPTFRAGIPRTLFRVEGGDYDVSPDGQRFVIARRVPKPADAAPELAIVVNWFEELRSRIAGK